MKDTRVEFVKTHCFECSRPISVPSTYKGRQPLCIQCRCNHTPAISQVVATSIRTARLGYIPKNGPLSLSIGLLLKQK